MASECYLPGKHNDDLCPMDTEMHTSSPFTEEKVCFYAGPEFGELAVTQ
jgi:hypothetical protein